MPHSRDTNYDLCTECQQLEQSDDHITLTLERPITPGDLEQVYCTLEETLE